MKFVIASLVALSAVVSARPEPPVNPQFAGYSTTHQDRFSPPPSPHHHEDYSNALSVQSARSQYSAPSNQYGAPAQQYSAPSSQYGAPSQQYSAPSSQYIAPARQYSAPSAQYGAPARQYSAPSAQYGAPSRSSLSHSRASSHRVAAPARSYGAPAQTAAVFLSAQPAAQYGAPSASYGAPAQYGAPNAGYSYGKNAIDDDLSEPANYEFSYDVQAAPQGGEFGHRESRQGDVTRGSYEVLLPDGRKQIVEYEADADGFRPTIRYEDVGGPYPAAGAGGPY